MAAITRNGAEMLGVDGEIGTIEPGKLGNVIVTDGNPLEIQTQVTDLFILGRQVSTDNKHKSLYEKYRARPRRSGRLARAEPSPPGSPEGPGGIVFPLAVGPAYP